VGTQTDKQTEKCGLIILIKTLAVCKTPKYSRMLFYDVHLKIVWSPNDRHKLFL